MTKEKEYIKDVNLFDVVVQNTKDYGEAVIENRAIPDYRDGLKPVARRILWAAYEQKMHPNGRYYKSARLVGDVMGRYHPHGDCLRSNTVVALCSGARPQIKDLLGSGPQWIWSVNTKTQELEPALAHSWRVGQITNRLCVITLSSGQKVCCSLNHPFLNSLTNKWIKAENLEIGTVLFGAKISANNNLEIQYSGGKKSYLHCISGKHMLGEIDANQVYQHKNGNTVDNNPTNFNIAKKVKKLESKTVKSATISVNDYCMVTKIKIIKRAIAIPLYDFTVDGNENMLISTGYSSNGSENLLVVHNSSIYDALVKMVNNPVSTIAKQGYFGAVNDQGGKAAMRYCLSGDTVISTEYGNVRMDDIPYLHGFSDEVLEKDGVIIDIKLNVQSLNGETAKATRWINSGKRQTYKLVFDNGFQLKATDNEPLLILDTDFTHKWVKVCDLKPGMYAACNRGMKCDDGSKHGLQHVNYALYAGYIISDGYIRHNETQFVSTCEEVCKEFASLLKCMQKHYRCYDREPVSYGVLPFKVFSFNGNSINEYINLRAGNSYTQTVPDSVMWAANNIVSAFLSAYFEGDGSITLIKNKNGGCKNATIAAHSVSKHLLGQIRMLLWTRFGIASSKINKEKSNQEECGYRIHITGRENIETFIHEIGFRSSRKQEKEVEMLEAFALIANTASNSKTDILPHYDLLPKNLGVKVGKTMRKFRTEYSKCDDLRFTAKLEKIAKSGYFYTKLTSKKINGFTWTYDLTVPETHAFTANGFVVHNTEVKLSEYGYRGFFNKYLDKVVDMMPNYDGHEIEPLFLPALYPNILMNGTSGIAVGATSDIPPLHIDSLMPFIETAINGGEISSKKLAKNIRFNWKYGSHCISSPEEIANWIKQSSQSLWFEPVYTLNSAKRTITVTEAVPNFDFEKIVEKLLGDMPDKGKKTKKRRYEWVSSVDDDCKINKKTGVGEACFVVKLKNTIDPEEFSTYAKIVINEFNNYVKTATNVTYRTPQNIKFWSSLSIPDLITRWVNYRVDMEKRIIQQIINEIDHNVAAKNLMLLAIDNRKIIKDAMEVSKPYDYVEEKLKITNEQSCTILGWSVISLAKISREKVVDDRRNLLVEKKSQNRLYNTPEPKILSDMSSGLKYFKG